MSQRQVDARGKLRTHGRHRKYGTHGMHGTRPIDVLFAARWLARWGAHKPLFLFDFDGTLAPLQPQRDAVVLADALRIDLRRLARRWPVAVVSGRGLADLRARLGRGAWRSYGSHGAEGLGGPHARRTQAAFAPTRRWCADQRDALLREGLVWEDKCFCAALHAGPGVDLHRALGWLLSCGLGPAVRIEAGHRVIDLTAAGTPDKGAAARHALRCSGAGALLVWGDDGNDEPAFDVARRHGAGFRVGPPATASAARWQLDGPRAVHRLVRRLARMRRAGGASA